MVSVVTPLAQLGAISEPSGKLPFSLPTAEGASWDPSLPWSMCRLPGKDGVLIANGWDPVRHVIDGTVYGTTLQAPSTAMTLATSGTGGSATLDCASYTIADGDSFNIHEDTLEVIFKTTLPTAALTGAASVVYVKIGASTSATLDNLKSMFAKDGVEGVDYRTLHKYGGESTGFYAARIVIQGGTKTASTLVFGAIEDGSSTNGFVADLQTGSWTGCTFGTGTPGTFSGGTDGAGSSPEQGTYEYFYTYFRESDGAESGPSPTAQIITTGAFNIDLSVIADPTNPADSSITHKRVYRTEDTGSEFFPLTDIPVATTTYTDSTENGLEDASLQGYNVQPYDSRLFRTYREGVVPKVRYVALWKSRVWGGGAIRAADYSQGTASVTEDSQTVTLSTSAVPTLDMVGREFQVDGDAQRYLILSVDASARTLTLNFPYEESTDATADYTVRDIRDGNQLFCSEAGPFNQWRPVNNPGQNDPDGDDEGITGMFATQDALLFWSRTGMYRVTGDDQLNWRVHKVVGGPGCAAGQSVTGVAGGVVWLAPDLEFYLYDGGGVSRIGNPPVAPGAQAQGIQGTLNRTNSTAMSRAFSYYCWKTKTIRSYLPLDDAVTPNTAIVYSLNNPGAWAMDNARMMTAAGRVTGPDGSPMCLLGDEAGNLWHGDFGSAFGGYDVEAVQSIASGATVNSIDAKTGTPWSSVTLNGCPVTVVRASGAYEVATIESNDGDTLTLREDLSSAPAEDDQVVVGMIPAIWESGFIVYDGYEERSLRSVQLVGQQDPLAIPVFWSSAPDRGTLVIPSESDDTYHDLNQANGSTRFDLSEYGSKWKQRLMVFHPGMTTGRILGRFLKWGDR